MSSSSGSALGPEDNLKREARDVAARSSQRARATAHDLGQSGRELAHEARQKLRSLSNDARERAVRFADEKRLLAARQCRLVCDSLGRASERFREGSEQTFLAGYIDSASNSVHAVADYFEQREPMEMLDDVRDFARERPGLVLGGMFALGIAVGRFLTASEDKGYRPGSQRIEGFGSGAIGRDDDLDLGEDFDSQWSVGQPIPVEPRWPRYEDESALGSSGSVRNTAPVPPAPVRHGDSPDEIGSLHESSSLRREETLERPKTEERR